MLISVVAITAAIILIEKQEPEVTFPPFLVDNIARQATIDDIVTATERLPDSPLKSNLYVVIASEYASDSTKLNEILQEFARLQIQILQQRKKGNGA